MQSPSGPKVYPKWIGPKGLASRYHRRVGSSDSAPTTPATTPSSSAAVSISGTRAPPSATPRRSRSPDARVHPASHAPVPHPGPPVPAFAGAPEAGALDDDTTTVTAADPTDDAVTSTAASSASSVIDAATFAESGRVMLSAVDLDFPCWPKGGDHHLRLQSGPRPREAHPAHYRRHGSRAGVQGAVGAWSRCQGRVGAMDAFGLENDVDLT